MMSGYFYSDVEIVGKRNYQGLWYPCRFEIPQGDFEGNYLVYGLIDPRDDSVFYVGATNNLIRRMKNHCRVARQVHPNKQRSGTHLLDLRKIEIYDAGRVIPVWIFAICATELEAKKIESEVIRKHLNTVMNSQTYFPSREGELQ